MNSKLVNQVKGKVNCVLPKRILLSVEKSVRFKHKVLLSFMSESSRNFKCRVQ